MPLIIRVAGVGEWSTDDYTLDEMVAAEKQRDDAFIWSSVLARALAGDAECVRALVAAWLARTEADPVAAIKRAGTFTNRQVTIKEAEEDDRPNQWEGGLPVVDPKTDGAAQGTTSSSPA